MAWIRELAHKLLQITHGRTTAFFVLFFIAGNILQWFGRLTTTYVAYMGTLGGLVLVHSIKEDLIAGRDGPRPDGGPDANLTK